MLRSVLIPQLQPFEICTLQSTFSFNSLLFSKQSNKKNWSPHNMLRVNCLNPSNIHSLRDHPRQKDVEKGTPEKDIKDKISTQIYTGTQIWATLWRLYYLKKNVQNLEIHKKYILDKRNRKEIEIWEKIYMIQQSVRNWHRNWKIHYYNPQEKALRTLSSSIKKYYSSSQ